MSAREPAGLVATGTLAKAKQSLLDLFCGKQCGGGEDDGERGKRG
jgi:hypothetical protein